MRRDNASELILIFLFLLHVLNELEDLLQFLRLLLDVCGENWQKVLVLTIMLNDCLCLLSIELPKLCLQCLAYSVYLLINAVCSSGHSLTEDLSKHELLMLLPDQVLLILRSHELKFLTPLIFI